MLTRFGGGPSLDTPGRKRSIPRIEVAEGVPANLTANLGIFQENIVNQVLEDVVRWAQPVWAEVKGRTFAAREDLTTVIAPDGRGRRGELAMSCGQKIPTSEWGTGFDDGPLRLCSGKEFPPGSSRERSFLRRKLRPR